MKPAKQLNTGYMLAYAGAALLLVLVIIWQLIAYAREQPDAGQFPIIVGVIALIGTILTGAVTFAGLLLKDSVDRRSASQQAESEKRLRMETALKAVELISKAEVDGAPIQESREAAIMVISSLNQDRLALNLAERFWNRDKISTEAFMDIVDQCLHTEDDDLNNQCCNALRTNYKKLVTDSGGIDLPASLVNKWNINLSFNAKHDFVISVIMATLSRPKSEWYIDVVNGVINIFYKMFLNDPDSRIQYMAATFANDLCDAFQPSGEYYFFAQEVQRISYREIRSAAGKIIATHGDPLSNLSDEARALSKRIKTWKEEEIAGEQDRAEMTPSDQRQ